MKRNRYPMVWKFLRLARDAIRVFQARPWPLERPRVLQFPVNDICNAGCQMCKIWTRKRDYEIAPAELDKVLGNALWQGVSVVGLNGGEPTLRRDLAEIAEVLHCRLPRLRQISLITNALVPTKVIARIDELVEVVRRHGTSLDVMISLDGIGAVHDTVRGRPGNFAKAVAVLDHVLTIDSSVTVRLGCTVVRDNVYGLHDLHEFAVQRGVYIKYRLGVPHQRLYNEAFPEPFALNLEERLHFAEFLRHVIARYEPSERQRFFYKSLIGQFLYGLPRTAGCDWQHRGATLSSRGELLYCAVKSPVLGSAITEDSSRLYFGSRAQLHEITQNECADCAHDYVGLHSPAAFYREVFGTLVTRFLPKLGAVRLPGVVVVPGRAIRFHQVLRRARRISASSAPKSILLCGWYGTETTGDKAILGGVVGVLRGCYGDAPITLASLDVPLSEVTLRQMPELGIDSVVSMTEAVATAGSAEVVVFAGGPIMGVRALAEIVALFERAAAADVPRVIAGCGVGPLGSGVHRRAIRRLLRLSTGQVFRDQTSIALATELGVALPDAEVAEDPAFSWLAGMSFPESANSKTLVLALREWPHEQYARGLSERAAERMVVASERAILDVLGSLVAADPELTLLPVPMGANHAGGDDRWYLRGLLAREPSLLARTDQRFLTQDVPPAQIAEAIGEASAALTMRYHSLVFAAAMQTPSVVLDYTLGHGKVADLSARLGLPCISYAQANRAWLQTNLNQALYGSPQQSAMPAPRFGAALKKVLVSAG